MFAFDHGLRAFFLSFRIYDEELTAYCGFLLCGVLQIVLNFHLVQLLITIIISIILPPFIKIRRRPFDFFQGTAYLNMD